MNGSARITYSSTRITGVPLIHSGVSANTTSTPLTSTIGGMTSGSRLIPSISRRSFGLRRCTQLTVGTMISSVSTTVPAATHSDVPSVGQRPGSSRTLPQDAKLCVLLTSRRLNSIEAAIGTRKYSPNRTRMSQRPKGFFIRATSKRAAACRRRTP